MNSMYQALSLIFEHLGTRLNYLLTCRGLMHLETPDLHWKSFYGWNALFFADTHMKLVDIATVITRSNATTYELIVH